MKKIIQLSCAVIFLMIVSSFTTYAQITCGTTITTNVTLTEDLDCSGYSGAAITIGANNITLDLNGHKITTTSGQIGILIPNSKSNITITSSLSGGKIDGPGDAIMIGNCSTVTISNIDLSWTGIGMSGKGLFCSDVDGLLIENVIVRKREESIITGKNIVVQNSSFEEGNLGIALDRIIGIKLSNVSVRNNTTGIFFKGIFFGEISINAVDLSGCNTGIYFLEFEYPLTINSAMFHGFGTVKYPILFATGSRNPNSNIIISGLDLSWSGTTKDGTGISGSGTSPNISYKDIIIDNVIVNNRFYGIRLSAEISSNIEIKNSTFNNNYWGLYLLTVDGLKLHNNNIKGNTLGGLYLGNVTNSNIYHNNICGTQPLLVKGIQPFELWNHETSEGNYWCVTCDDKGFIPGTTSNREDIIDDFAYGTENGWLLPPDNPDSKTCQHPPVALCQDVIVSTNENTCYAEASIDNGSYDPDEDDQLTIVQNPAGPYSVGTTQVTLTVTDSRGETASCNGTVTVIDDIPPTVITKNPTVELKNGTASITVDMVNNGSTDNCDIASITLDKETFDCNDAGENVNVIMTVTDVNDNSATGTATVYVQGSTPTATITVDPERTIPEGDLNTIYLGYGPQSVTLKTNASGGNDLIYSWTSEPAGFTSNEQNPTVSPTVTTTYTLVVTNEFGCSTTVAASVTILIVDWRCGNDLRKIKVCHNGKTICVDDNAVQQHLDHGDYIGECINGKFNTGDDEIGTQSATLEFSPNPLSNSAHFTLEVFDPVMISIDIVDVFGKLVANLMNEQKTVGTYTFDFDASDLQAGVYYCHLMVGNEITTMKLVIVR